MSNLASDIFQECLQVAHEKHAHPELETLYAHMNETKSLEEQRRVHGENSDGSLGSMLMRSKQQIVAELKRLLPEYNDIRLRHYVKDPEFVFEPIKNPNEFLGETEHIAWGVWDEEEDLRIMRDLPMFDTVYTT